MLARRALALDLGHWVSRMPGRPRYPFGIRGRLVPEGHRFWTPEAGGVVSP
jgi:hypothetical protein